MNVQSNRKFDTSQEQIINQFVHTYFCLKVDETSEYITDKEQQIKGIDEICGGHKIDFKAQSSNRYLNNPQPTFILELLFKPKYEQNTIGWFLNPNLETELYGFIWIPKCKVNDKGAIAYITDIEDLELLLVDKKTMYANIMTHYTEQQLIDNAEDMQNAGITNMGCDIYGLKYSHSPKLFEKPVNLVAQKWWIQKFKVGHYIITKDGYKAV